MGLRRLRPAGYWRTKDTGHSLNKEGQNTRILVGFRYPWAAILVEAFLLVWSPLRLGAEICEMARNQYFVVLHDGQWKISHNQKHYGPYQSQKAAIRAAVDAAHESKGDSQVLVQGTNNQYRTEWTYGHDPYPPPG